MPARDSGGQEYGNTTVLAYRAGGIGALSLGLLTLVWPGKTVETVQALFGGYLLISAAVQGYIAFQARLKLPLRLLMFGTAVFTVALAVLCLRGDNTALILALWLGIGVAAAGIMQAVTAVWDDELAHSWRLEAAGGLAVVLGGVLLISEFHSVTSMATTAAICLMLAGGAQVLAAGLRIPRRLPEVGPAPARTSS